jgi:HlyD family secretion protein
MKRALAIFAALMIAGCGEHDETHLNGYVEAETLYLAPQEAGVIAEIAVREGDAVKADDLLFRLDAGRLSYGVEQAAATVAAAQRRVEASGALDQAIAEAEADLNRLAGDFARTEKLYREGFISKARFDTDRASVAGAQARLERARAEKSAAQEDLLSAQAQAGLAGQRRDDLAVYAPQAGTIERIYRRAGEVAAAGDPVIALLPPENIKLRFFAPEPLLSSLAPGGEITFACDGCAENLTARVTFIAAEPQFTPPVIYSLDERTKLVFLVEARPLSPEGLRPGLPVSVRLP